MTFDFHTHSFFSDGVLSPIELIRRAHVAGYRAIAVTDHVGLANIEQVIREVSRDCLLAEKHWGIKALPGVELTHIPAAAIGECAKLAKKCGATAATLSIHMIFPAVILKFGTEEQKKKYLKF